MSKKLSRGQFIKKSAAGLAFAGAAVAMGKILYQSSAEDLPNPYPVLPDKKPAIPSFEGKPLFFNIQQYNIIAALAALIIPTDDTPGASEAGVASYIDRMVAVSENKQKIYIEGLEWVDNTAKKQYGNNFIELAVKEQIELLMAIDETESKINRRVSGYIDRVNRKIDELWIDVFGGGDSNRFFHVVRQDVFYSYYSNPVSWPVIGYYGPPQPAGYLDYGEPPSSEKYISTIRPMKNNICQNCHFDQLEKKDHKDQSDCLDCHEIHFPFQ